MFTFFFFTWTKTEFHAYNMQISLFSKETVVKKDTTDLFFLQNKQKKLPNTLIEDMAH